MAHKRSTSEPIFILSPLCSTYDKHNYNKIQKPMPTPTEPMPTPKPNNIYRFHSFGHPGCPATFSGAFRDNMREFLPIGSNPWPIKSRCRYHFIIAASDQSLYVLHSSTHLLHGLIHCNGFGHLLSLNGRENGSKHLSCHHTMDLLDHICSMLCTRKVTVEDTARKHSMELHLLHSAAYGHPCFSQWGYSFCHGSFGITELRYSMAVKILKQLPLAMPGPQHQDAHLHCIVGEYKTICNSVISTLGELLHAMLLLNACLPWQTANAAPTINGS
ncbi:hypothetical protein AMTR_s00043p00044990 [Amborella trichopoda]|uniref:Uncharacterized protein n=1 Tax=Amborella trichopoda TaxID=13333 RepID=W1PXV6_AMBTC|nr:hypothetical protein AMTR_s00043p00044990 [Amborella trichopoda]